MGGMELYFGGGWEYPLVGVKEYIRIDDNVCWVWDVIIVKFE